jgi:hypothetical protein
MKAESRNISIILQHRDEPEIISSGSFFIVFRRGVSLPPVAQTVVNQPLFYATNSAALALLM